MFRFFHVPVSAVVCYSCCAQCGLLKVPEGLDWWGAAADWCWGAAWSHFNWIGDVISQGQPGRCCLRSWCGDSLEVTFCSVMNHSLILAVGDRLLVVQYFMVVQSSAQFGRGWNSSLVTCHHPEWIWQSWRAHFNVINVHNPSEWLCLRSLTANGHFHITLFCFFHPFGSLLVFQMGRTCAWFQSKVSC